jgi:hypothetical protein
VNLRDADGRGQVSIAQHAPAKERISHVFAEEDTSNLGRDIGKCIPHTPNDNVLEDGRMLDKRGPHSSCGKASLLDELIRQLNDWGHMVSG